MLQNIPCLTRQPKIFIPMVINYSRCPEKQKTCPGAKRKAVASGPSGGAGKFKDAIKRAKESGKCRMGFIPEEWFLFLKPITGVSGPYLLMLGLANYAASKEILVMEHEYYLGLSVFLVLYFLSTRFGRKLGEILDKEVDEVVRELEKSRIEDVVALNAQIKDINTATWRAEGQKDLITAKKENIAVQLEAVFRERQMMVYNSVRKRLDYHVKRYWITRRLKQKWMAQWVLQNVEKAITPEFRKATLDNAIKDFAALTEKAVAGSKK